MGVSVRNTASSKLAFLIALLLLVSCGGLTCLVIRSIPSGNTERYRNFSAALSQESFLEHHQLYDFSDDHAGFQFEAADILRDVDADVPLRLNAFLYLSSMCKEQSSQIAYIEALVDSSLHVNRELVQMIIDAIGYLNIDGFEDYLVTLINDDSQDIVVRKTAIIAVGRLGARTVIPHLLVIYDGTTLPALRNGALTAIAEIEGFDYPLDVSDREGRARAFKAWREQYVADQVRKGGRKRGRE